MIHHFIENKALLQKTGFSRQLKTLFFIKYKIIVV